MPTHSFKLVLRDIKCLDDVGDDFADKIYEAMPDATLASSCGEAFVMVDREAKTMDEAIRSAIADLRRAGFEVNESKTEVDSGG
jgi:hypothetical protein